MCALLVVLVEWSCSGGRAASRTETRSISVAGAGASSPPSLLFAQVAVVLKRAACLTHDQRAHLAQRRRSLRRAPLGAVLWPARRLAVIWPGARLRKSAIQ